MRVALLAAVLLAPLTAIAEPSFTDVIKQPPKHRGTGGPIAFTNVSRVIYLNPCLPNGCTVYPGNDDSRTDHSSIPNQSAVLTAFPHGTAAWSTLVQCVKDMYAPFNVQVTDVDPGTAPHFEVMVAGNANAIGVPGAGGVAPFVPCDGALEDNVISFVFAAQTANQDFLCWAAAQESAHVFGLDHELNANDPMTYIAPPYHKAGFQNEASDCGEDSPRECYCGGNKQNSYQYLMDTFGPPHLDPGSVSITEPKDGDWVKPGFTVKFALMSQLSMTKGSLNIDGSPSQQITPGADSVKSPAQLAGGDHVIEVQTVDSANRMFTSQITVHVTAACNVTPCAGDFHCLGGYCLPGAETPGGLGATCTGNDQCITDLCGSDGTSQLCTGSCDVVDGKGVCPDGYTCYQSGGAAGVCWPKEETGCCSTSTSNTPWHALFGLGVLALVIRRKRR